MGREYSGPLDWDNNPFLGLSTSAPWATREGIEMLRRLLRICKQSDGWSAPSVFSVVARAAEALLPLYYQLNAARRTADLSGREHAARIAALESALLDVLAVWPHDCDNCHGKYNPPTRYIADKWDGERVLCCDDEWCAEQLRRVGWFGDQDWTDLDEAPQIRAAKEALNAKS